MIKKTIILSIFSVFAFANTNVIIETNKGNFKLEIYDDNPILQKTTKNFLTKIKNGYYEKTIFHRVIKNFMIQGGDPTGTGRGGESIYGSPFNDEIDQKLNFNYSGVLAMANAGPGTNGSQFFITTKPTPWLKGKHTIFGKIISGNDVLNKINSTSVDGRSKPLIDIIILKTKVE